MSGLGGLLLVSISVGLSNFAGAIGIGISGVDARTRLRVGLAFGLFEAAMPLIGLLIGRQVAGSLGAYSRYVGAGLLVATGLYTIIQGIRAGQEVTRTLSPRDLLITAAALSLDNLIVGFALGVYRINLVLAAVMMGGVSVTMSLVGLELGQRLGERVEQWSDELGGAVLVLVGIALGLGLL